MALNANKLKLAEHTRNVFAITLNPDETFEDALKPEYWAHTAAKLRAHDRIEVDAADLTWSAELVVAEVRPTEAVVLVKSYVKLSRKAPENTVPAETIDKSTEFYREWDAKAQAHRIVRKSDKAVVEDGIKDKALADKKVYDLNSQAALV